METIVLRASFTNGDQVVFDREINPGIKKPTHVIVKQVFYADESGPATNHYLQSNLVMNRDMGNFFEGVSFDPDAAYRIESNFYGSGNYRFTIYNFDGSITTVAGTDADVGLTLTFIS